MTLVLKLGSKGDYVAAVQFLLSGWQELFRDSELPQLVINGEFDTATRARLIEFSRRNPWFGCADGKVIVGRARRAGLRVMIWMLRLKQWNMKRRGVTKFSYEF